MQIGKLGLDLIKSYEGLRLKAYKCPANVWTIGYGSTHGVFKGQALKNEQAAVKLLAQDLGTYERAVNNAVDVDITQNQFDALVSFTYNLGGGALRKSTLLRKLNQGDKVGAYKEFKKWNKAGGRILRGLVLRRAAEAELFLRGDSNE